MSQKNRGVIIGTSGLFAGGLAASVVPWSTWPEAALVVVVAALVSSLVWAVLPSKAGPDQGETESRTT